MDNNKCLEEPEGKVVEAKCRNVIQETIRCYPWGNRVLKRICLDGPNDLYSLSKNLSCSYNSNREIFQQFGLQQCHFLNYSPHQFTAEEEPFSWCYKDCILTRYNSQRLFPGILHTRCLRSDTIKCLIVGEGSFKSNVIENWTKLDKRVLINFINYRRHKDYLEYFLGKSYFNIQLVLEECSLCKSISFLIILDTLMDYL